LRRLLPSATGLLVGATILAVVGLAVSTAVTARRQRDLATQALRDFAYLGGNTYTYRIFSGIANFTAELKVAVERKKPRTRDEALHALRGLIDSVNRCQCGLPTRIVSIGAGELKVPESVTLSTPDSLASLERQSRDLALRRFAVAPFLPQRAANLITGADSTDRWLMVAFGVKGADGQNIGFFAYEPDALGLQKRLFEYLFGMRPLLLSPSLTGQSSNMLTGSLTIATRAGAILYQSSPRYHTSYAGTSMMGGDSSVFVSFELSPIAAETIVRGALPSSRPTFDLALPVLAFILICSTALALRRASNLAELRSQFAASVTHELRTPLTQILLNAETLEFGRASSEDERQRIRSGIVREARRLVYLVENVLHFSRAERRILTAQPRPTRIDLVVSGCVDNLQTIVDAGGATIEVDAPDAVTGLVDSEGLRLALTNLVDNAVHYAPGGTVRVTVRAEATDVQVTVDDSGPGIAASERERALKPFERLADASERHPTGSGIGLAVVAEIMRASGGAVTLGEAPEGGLRARLTFPLAASSPDMPGFAG
jgi:signal transduction histidine kinase